jgi:predicted Zn-dependent protease
MLDLARGNRDVALAQFREAQRVNPSLPQGYLFEAQALSAAGDASAATDALRRGLAVVPGDRRLTAALAALGAAP